MDENLKVNPSAPIRDATQLIDNGPIRAVEASGFVGAVRAEYGISPN
jgi:hypothetical protein